MHRFFIDPDFIENHLVTFPKNVAHQITYVLRLTPNDFVAVLDNSGVLYEVKLLRNENHKPLCGKIENTITVQTEPKTQITLHFSLTAREKMDWILQKGTEIGVTSFQPFFSSRSLVKSGELSVNKIERWKRIIREAAEQSGRGKLPRLKAPKSLSDCFYHLPKDDQLNIIAWEEAPEKKQNLHKLLTEFIGNSINIFVGPEGGFSPEEINTAIQAQCKVISLGPRIFRMETASIVLPAIVLHQIRE